MKVMTVTIDPANGDVDVDLAGYQGKGCHAVQEAMTKALGGDVKVERRKPEFNTPLTNKVAVTR